MLQTSCYMMLTLATERALMIIEIPPPPPPHHLVEQCIQHKKLNLGKIVGEKMSKGHFQSIIGITHSIILTLTF